jgi:hypothetical protein
VIWAVWLDVMPPTVAVTVPVVWPAEIVTLAGTVMVALLLETVTLAPPDGAGAVKVIVQLADPGAATVPGEHETDESCTAAVRLKLTVLAVRPVPAVTMAVWLELTWPAVAVKPAEVWPEGTVTLAGTVRFPLLLTRGTANPPPGAAEVSVTVQGVLPGVAIVRFEQFTALIVGGRDTDPDTPLEGIEDPPAVEATTPVSCIGSGFAEGLAAIWKVAVATAPLPIALVDNPNTRHVFPLQDTDLPAAEAALPVTTVTPVISEE